MAERKELGRLLTAMATPFTDSGEFIDRERTQTLARHLITHGTEGIVVTGTTGESPTLDSKQRHQVIDLVATAVGDRVPVIAGTSTYSTLESAHYTREAIAAGADALLWVTPYYNTKSQRSLLAHFSALAEATRGEVPTILYNVPSRTGVNIEPETVWELQRRYPEVIVGLKEARGLATAADMNHVHRILNRKEKPEGFKVWSGNDADTFEMMSAGAYGVVSVLSHIAGEKIAMMVGSVDPNRPSSKKQMMAREIHEMLLPLAKGLFPSDLCKEPSPVELKYILQALDMSAGPVRLPLVEPTDEEKEALYQLLVDNRHLLDSDLHLVSKIPIIL